MLNAKNYPAFAISLAVHFVLLGAMAFYRFQLQSDDPKLALETVFTEDREQEEISQELDQQDDIAETMNVIAGSTAVSQVTGAAAGPVANQQKIETSEALKEPDLKVNPSEISIPGNVGLNEDLGVGEVSGEVGAVVEGYGAALHQITQELIRMMREQKVLVVWLFDESLSMKDDQEEIRQNFHKIYEELGIAAKQDEKIRATDEVLLTSIMSFAANVTEQTAKGKPTKNVEEIRAAIGKIGINDGKEENMCQSIVYALDQYTKMAQRADRRLVVVVVMDESGTDGQFIEDAVAKATRAKAPVYILGRYSVFGYPYARYRWVDPKYGLPHWLQIERGPETPFVEALQFNGFRRREDVFSSGFGPYEQVRLCKKTGGIFFLLPGTEDNLVGTQGSAEQRRFQFYDMREYLPDLGPRVEYAKERDSSKFRSTVFDVIQRLNPYKDDKLSIRTWHLAAEIEQFRTDGKDQFDKAVYAMQLLNQAVGILDGIKPLRDKEASERWRANYDLIYAQCLCYRVRLFQFLLAMDQHIKAKRLPKEPKNNAWDIHIAKKMLEPDEQQIKLTGVKMDELQQQQQKATEMYQLVLKNHPGTPWAQRAEVELSEGFGVLFHETYHDPRYDDLKDIKFPNP